MAFLPNFNRCCFFLNLRTGTLCFGVFSLISTVLMITWRTFVLYNHAIEWQEAETDEELLTAIGLTLVSSVDILLKMGLFVMAIVLIIGVLKSLPSLIRYFVIFRTCLLIYSMLVVCVNMSLSDYKYNALEVFYCVLSAYWTLAVYNYYKQVKNSSKPPEAQVVYRSSVTVTDAPSSQNPTQPQNSSQAQPQNHTEIQPQDHRDPQHNVHVQEFRPPQPPPFATMTKTTDLEAGLTVNAASTLQDSSSLNRSNV